MSRPLSWATVSAGTRSSLPARCPAPPSGPMGTMMLAAAAAAGLDDDEDRQAFRALLRRLAVHAATALESAALDGCTAGRAAAAPPGAC